MFRYVDHTLIYCTEGLHAEPLAWTSHFRDGSPEFSFAQQTVARRWALQRDGLVPMGLRTSLTVDELEAHRLQSEQGPCVDPRSKGDSDPRDLDADDHPLQVDTDDASYGPAWNRARVAHRRLKDGDIDAEKLEALMDDIYADTGHSFPNDTYAWEFGDEADLHMTTQEHLAADRATITWLGRDTEDERREIARNSEMATKDDEQDRPTRQGGQYVGTLENEHAMLLHSLRGLRGTYRELLEAAVAKGFSVKRAKGHAQLVYKANEAQAMIDRFNVRRLVNAIEQLSDDPDFPSAWKAVMARKLQTKATYRTMLDAYVAKVAEINRQALIGECAYLGVEGLLKMNSPVAKMTPLTEDDKKDVVALRAHLGTKLPALVVEDDDNGDYAEEYVFISDDAEYADYEEEAA